MSIMSVAEAILRYTEREPESSPFVTAVPGLTLLRSAGQKRPNHRIFKPALCLTVQGTKSACFGEQTLYYSAGQALVVGLETPGLGTITEASPSSPYLGLVLEFDLALMRELLGKLETRPKPNYGQGRGPFVASCEFPLLESILRLLSLLNNQQALPILAEGRIREIYFWLLAGPEGGDLIATMLRHQHEYGIVSAIHALRDRFKETLRTEHLARIARMSPSAFCRHFKAITSMTPLQYQKQLRLLEARRLLFSECRNVEATAFAVGYESASQFSREYSRMFAMSPRRHAAALSRNNSRADELMERPFAAKLG